MKHLDNIPICANTLFIYKLDIKDDLISKFTKEKFKYIPTGSGVGRTIDLHILKKYKELDEEINKAINTTIKETLMLKKTSYRISKSWLLRIKPNGFSDSHFHGNSWLSGVYYPKGDSGFSIRFFNDNKTQFSSPPTEYNIFNANHWHIVPEDNLLILFFSQLRHKVMPNLSTTDRFSLSFNLLPKGKFGRDDSETIF